MSTYRIKRIYEQPSTDDGYRVLVDRLWPRGVSKERAALDEWDKDIAPSTDLRKWFDHDPAKFDEFRARYEDELASNPAVGKFAAQVASQATVTLLYGARDPRVNHAVVLADFLKKYTA